MTTPIPTAPPISLGALNNDVKVGGLSLDNGATSIATPASAPKPTPSPTKPVTMVDTNSAITKVNSQKAYLDTTAPINSGSTTQGPDLAAYNAKVAAQNGGQSGNGAGASTPPKPVSPATADFTNEAGQTATYNQDQLNDPTTQQFLKNNGYVLTNSNGLNVNSDFTLSGKQTDYNNAANAVQNLANKVASYNVDQDPAFQALADNIRASYNDLIDSMKQTNASLQASYTTTGMREGTTQYANNIQTGVMGEAIRQGDTRIADLVTKENAAISAARSAYQKDEYSNFNQQINDLKDIRDQKATALKDLNTAIQTATKEAHAQAEQTKKDTYAEVTKPIQDIATEAAKNGAGKAIISAINSATSVQDAIKAAGDSLQTGTGQMGEYLQYKRDTAANGLAPEDFAAWKAADDKRQARLKSSEAYATAFATAKGKAAGEKTGTGTENSLPVTGNNGVTYNVPATVAPYVKISPSGVKYVDVSGLSAAEKGKVMSAAFNNGVNPVPVITDPTAALDVSNIADASLKLQDMKNAFDQQVAGSALARDSYFAGAIKMASALQTNPQAVGLDIYQDTALDILKAMSGTKGFRGGTAMVDQVKTTFPQKTDTQAVVDQKIANIQKLLDDREVSLIGRPSAGDQLLIDNTKAKSTINNYVSSVVAQDPKNGAMQANHIGTLASAPGATPASILEYMKLHPEIYAAQYLK